MSTLAYPASQIQHKTPLAAELAARSAAPPPAMLACRVEMVSGEVGDQLKDQGSYCEITIIDPRDGRPHTLASICQGEGVTFGTLHYHCQSVRTPEIELPLAAVDQWVADAARFAADEILQDMRAYWRRQVVAFNAGERWDGLS